MGAFVPAVILIIAVAIVLFIIAICIRRYNMQVQEASSQSNLPNDERSSNPSRVRRLYRVISREPRPGRPGRCEQPAAIAGRQVGRTERIGMGPPSFLQAREGRGSRDTSRSPQGRTERGGGRVGMGPPRLMQGGQGREGEAVFDRCPPRHAHTAGGSSHNQADTNHAEADRGEDRARRREYLWGESGQSFPWSSNQWIFRNEEPQSDQNEIELRANDQRRGSVGSDHDQRNNIHMTNGQIASGQRVRTSDETNMEENVAEIENRNESETRAPNNNETSRRELLWGENNEHSYPWSSRQWIFQDNDPQRERNQSDDHEENRNQRTNTSTTLPSSSNTDTEEDTGATDTSWRNHVPEGDNYPWNSDQWIFQSQNNSDGTNQRPSGQSHTHQRVMGQGSRGPANIEQTNDRNDHRNPSQRPDERARNPSGERRQNVNSGRTTLASGGHYSGYQPGRDTDSPLHEGRSSTPPDQSTSSSRPAENVQPSPPSYDAAMAYPVRETGSRRSTEQLPTEPPPAYESVAHINPHPSRERSETSTPRSQQDNEYSDSFHFALFDS